MHTSEPPEGTYRGCQMMHEYMVPHHHVQTVPKGGPNRAQNGVQNGTQMSRYHEIHGFGEIPDFAQNPEIQEIGQFQ